MSKFIFASFLIIFCLFFILWLIYPDPRPEIQITFPEGFTNKQIQERLQANSITGEITEELQGYLFPDTYRFYENALLDDVIAKMRKNFDKKVGKINYEDLILASIIQKEVANPEDMQVVAGIFLKRLKVNMPLQSDATVNFVTGKNLTQPSIEDTKQVSPYNTYQNLGLPPGPICNPGLKAIQAVQNPIASQYWYFLTRPDQEVIFSKTLEEHNIAKKKYLSDAGRLDQKLERY